MIKRIVKLHFKAALVPKFIGLFERSKDKIRKQEGCFSLELLKVANDPCIFFTLSIWENEAALDKYRHSALFKEVWTETKALFDKRAEAWTVESIIDLE
jgi:quinol monooxygenase YgiN